MTVIFRQGIIENNPNSFIFFKFAKICEPRKTDSPAVPISIGTLRWWPSVIAW